MAEREADHLVTKFRMSGAISPFPLMPLSRAQLELQFSLSLRTFDHFRKQDNTVALLLVLRTWNPTSVVLESQRLGYVVFLPVKYIHTVFFAVAYWIQYFIQWSGDPFLGVLDDCYA